MSQGWIIHAERLVAALKPATVLDIGEGDEFYSAVEPRVSTWGGTVTALRPPYGPEDIIAPEPVDLVALHGEPNWWTASWQLSAVAALAAESGRSLPPIVVANTGPPWGLRDCYRDPAALPSEAVSPYRREGDVWVARQEGTPRNGVRTAVEDFAREHRLELLFVPGLGGTAIITTGEDSVNGPARQLLDQLRLPPLGRQIVESVDEALRTERSRSAEIMGFAAHARDLASERDELLAELEALRHGMSEMTAQVAAERVRADAAENDLSSLERLAARSTATHLSPAPIHPGAAATSDDLADEPSRELVRAILEPAGALAALRWDGDEQELSLPIPCDLRGVIRGDAESSLVVMVEDEALAVRRTLCSIIDRARVPVAVTLLVTRPLTQPLKQLLDRIRIALPGAEVAEPGRFRPAPGAQRLAAGEELPWGWPQASPDGSPLSVVYLVPGLPPEGSGGLHSIVQETCGLRDLGAQASICVPASALGRARRLYGDGLFGAYEERALVKEANVAVATEHTSIPMLADVADACPHLKLGYYVQDYEPLFAELRSRRADRALLSYRALAGVTLYAKTHFLRNVIAARHRVPVLKVEPSLDRALFNADARSEDARPLVVTAMVRPRTPRRRPRATLAALTMINGALGEKVQIVTFGCDLAELEGLGTPELSFLEHRGPLSRDQVAAQLRVSDVFIDGSAYQAFGRTGLEAMACGAVPVLPSLGGVAEYAVDGRNAIVLADDSPGTVAEAVIALVADRDRLAALRHTGIEDASHFSIERAARSQLAMLSAIDTRAATSR